MPTQTNPGVANPRRHELGFTGPGSGWAVASHDTPADGPSQSSPAQDADFVFLQQAFRPSGGLAHGDELAVRLHVDGAGGYARLARWIVGRQAFSFTWHEHFWLPLFQFDMPDAALSQRLRPVLSELADVMDGLALANWFAQPNDDLNGHSPVSLWSAHWPEVHQAARQQRFVMKG